MRTLKCLLVAGLIMTSGGNADAKGDARVRHEPPPVTQVAVPLMGFAIISTMMFIAIMTGHVPLR